MSNRREPDSYVKMLDPRVWRAVLGKRKATPGLVALAASACPEILGEAISRKQYAELSGSDKWDALRNGAVVWNQHDSLAETESSVVAVQCGTSAVQIRNALAEWVMAQKEARTALELIAKWDRKLGLWCACAVAESCLMLIPTGTNQARVAIETGRAWLLGDATFEDMLKASEATKDTATELARSDADLRRRKFRGYYSAFYAASCAIDSVLRSATSGPAYAGASVTYASTAYASSIVGSDSEYPRWKLEQAAEMVRLRDVVAQGVISYPSSEMINPSGGITRSAVGAAVVGAIIGAGAMHLARKL